MVGTIVAVTSVLLGLCLGSFANVVIWRVPRGDSVISPPSRCLSCGTELAIRDNVPVIGWVVLRGRCRTCRQPISPRYPVIEAMGGLLGLAAFARYGATPETAAYLALFLTLLILAVIDIDVHRVPTAVLLPAGAICAGLVVVSALVDDRTADLVRAGIGGVIGFAALFVIHTVRPDGMGFGDVRLAALLGFMLGYQGLGFVGLGLFAGFLLGAVVGSTLIALGKGEFGRHIPFVPYLAAGTFLTLLVGEPFVDWYAGLIS